MSTQLSRDMFDSDLLIAEQEAYTQGSFDAHAGEGSDVTRYPADLTEAYTAGYDETCDNL